MIYTYPDYYDKFECIAGECEDTCCAGWQILIDDKSYRKYRGFLGEYKQTLSKRIDWKNQVFLQSKQRRCAFLRDDNLCDMYLNMGCDSLCNTCAKYPRHEEEFENVREISLSMSCPEAARILMNHTEDVFYTEQETPQREVYEDFDEIFYDALFGVRTHMFEILKRKELSLFEKAIQLLGIARDVQVHVNHNDLFAYESICKRYKSAKAKKFISEKIISFYENQEKTYRFLGILFARLYRLERLNESWQDLLEETQAILYHKDAREYFERHHEFVEQYFLGETLENELELKGCLERLLEYYIYTYFCGAVYDGRIFAKTQLAVCSVFYIEQILFAKWIGNEKHLDMEDVVEAVYRYSRELEHSDLNLECMEVMMEHISILAYLKKLS